MAGQVGGGVKSLLAMMKSKIKTFSIGAYFQAKGNGSQVGSAPGAGKLPDKGPVRTATRGGVEKQIRQIREAEILDRHPLKDMAIEKGWDGKGSWIDHLRRRAAAGDREAAAALGGLEREVIALDNRLKGLERQLREMDAPPGPWEMK